MHSHAAHDVMRCRPDSHRLVGDMNIGELFKLMIHARQFPLNVFGGIRHFLFNPRDIEKHTAVRTSPALFDLTHDATRDVITREQLGWAPRVFVSPAIAPSLLLIVRSLGSIIFWNRLE